MSQEARKLLDEAGFSDALIFASNDLDEELILSLKEQGARIGVWAVGTHLAAAYGQPALGGVYKLSALKDGAGKWVPKIKLSEQAIKVSNPGILQVRRFITDAGLAGDMIFDQSESIEPASHLIVDPEDFTRRKSIPPQASHEDLLVPVFRGGAFVYQLPTLSQIRDRTRKQLSLLHSGVKRFKNPHRYPVGLEKSLHELKTQLIFRHRGYADSNAGNVKGDAQ